MQDLQLKQNKVMEILLEKPFMLSRDIAETLDIGARELNEIYRSIQECAVLRGTLVSKSIFQEFFLTYTQLLEDIDWLENALYHGRVMPKIVEYHPSVGCNYDCTHCFSFGVDYEELATKEDRISVTRMMQIIEEIAQNGVEQMWFSGGKEPFASEDTPILIKHASDMGLRVRVYTNGFLLNQHICKTLMGAEQIRISVDSSCPDTYDMVHYGKARGGNALGIVSANIKQLIEMRDEIGSSLKIAISQIVSSGNYDQIFDFVCFGQDLGVDSVQIRREFVGRTQFAPYMFHEIESQITEIGKHNWACEVDVRGLSARELNNPEKSNPSIPRTKYCWAGLYKRGINPWGHVYHCEFTCHPVFAKERSHLRLGDLKKDSFKSTVYGGLANLPPTSRCEFCQSQGIGLNWQMYKLLDDSDFGIPISFQPFRRLPNVR